MIVLTDLAHKLEEILNNSVAGSKFQFVVKSQGYHLDSIADQKTGKNTIPVFVGIAGGEYNAVPNLKQVNFNYAINIWFPVRFKEDFYLLNEYLEDTFVAKIIDINGQKALCNISVAEYSEITDVHLDKFEEWVDETYEGAVRVMKKEHDISEEYMSMTFNLYATTLGDGYSFGNDVKYELEMDFMKLMASYSLINRIRYRYLGGYDDMTIDSVRYYGWRQAGEYDETMPYKLYIKDNPREIGGLKPIIAGTSVVYDYVENEMVETEYSLKNIEVGSSSLTRYTYSTECTIARSGTGANISPVAQQRIKPNLEATSTFGRNYALNIRNITNFNKTFLVYPKNNDNFWEYFKLVYNLQCLEAIESCYLIKKYNDGSAYSYKQLILDVKENIELGQPHSFTITLGDAV